MRYIFTCNAKYRKLAVYELEKFDESSIFQQWLDEGVGLFESSLKPNQLSDLIICTPIIFIRHVFKVDKFLDSYNIQEEIVQICIERINKEDICSIQTRFAQGSKKNLNLTSDIANLLIKLDMKIDVESSEKVIFIYGMHVYSGDIGFIRNYP